MLLSVGFVSAFAGGDGTSGAPYQIANATHLQNMSADLNAHYVLNNDIDLNVSPYNETAGFTPLGDFNGVFNGAGFTIENLYVNLTSSGVGLFSEVSGIVANVSLVDVNISGGSAEIGGVTGYLNEGEIYNVAVSGIVGTVAGDAERIGGIAGWMSSAVINNSESSVLINASAEQVGGLVGRAQTSSFITGSSFTGILDVSEDQVGGLVGRLQTGSSLVDSESAATITVEGGQVGGLVGSVSSTTTTSFINSSSSSSNVTATDPVVGSASSIGGAVGYSNSGGLFDVQVSGYVKGSNFVGGVIGSLDNGVIANSNFTGAINATSTRVGGLVGEADGSQIIDSFVDANIESQGNFLGGLAGDASSITINNSHVVSNISGIAFVGGLMGTASEGTGVYGSSANTTIATESGFVGGLVGNDDDASLIIQQSFANTTIVVDAGSSDGRVGGLVGSTSGEITDSYAVVNISATEDYAGGLVGYFSGTVLRANATGTIVSEGGFVGGLTGFAQDAVINDTHADVNVTGWAYVGGLVGEADGSPLINNSHAQGFVNATTTQAGGFVGRIFTTQGVIDNSYATGDVNASTYSGGFVGSSVANISNSYATGDVFASGMNVGGFVGTTNLGFITSSYASGGVYNDAVLTGGFVGRVGTDAQIMYSNATGQVENLAGSVGGFAGDVQGNVSYSYTNASVNATGDDAGVFAGIIGGVVINSEAQGLLESDSGRVGGFVGSVSTNGVVEESFANSTVIGDNNVGGFAGRIQGTVANAYSFGSIEPAQSLSCGGFVGYITGSVVDSYSATEVIGCSNSGFAGGISSNGVIEQSFWDVDTSGQASSEGEGSGNLTGLPTSEMTFAQAFFDAGWDFEEVWGHNTSENDGYMTLQWQGFGSEDVTPPTISAVVTSSDTSSFTISWDTDKLANATIDYGVGVESNSSMNTTHELVVSGLSAGTTYNYELVACGDYGTCSSESGSVSTQSQPTTSTSGGSSGGGGGGFVTQELTSEGSLRTLVEGQSSYFNIPGFAQRHSIMLIALFEGGAGFTVMSVPQNLTLDVGEHKLLDVNFDGVYDLNITLERVTESTAHFRVATPRGEVIVEEEPLEEESVQEVVNTTTESTTTQEETAQETADTTTESTTQEATSTPESSEQAEGSNWPLVALIAAVVLLVVGAGLFFMRRK